MSTVAPSKDLAEATDQRICPTNISVDRLVSRLDAEVSAARQRVTSLQEGAAREYECHEQLLLRFATVADRIQEILLPRLVALTTVNPFKDIKQSVRPERRGCHGRGSHGRTTTLTVPYSDKRPAPMELSFHVDHDGAIENVVMEYRLKILPIFIKFDSQDQLVIPIDQPYEKALVAWIDDKLVEFTRVYFEVYFHDEYQKKNLEMDPVMNVRFPRAFAVGKKEYLKRTYYFYTLESLEKWEKNPNDYVD